VLYDDTSLVITPWLILMELYNLFYKFLLNSRRKLLNTRYHIHLTSCKADYVPNLSSELYCGNGHKTAEARRQYYLPLSQSLIVTMISDYETY